MKQIETLNREHNRATFDCGVAPLNDFLKNLAHQNLKKGLSRTFVVTDEKKSKEILGLYTVSLCEINSTNLPEIYAKKYKGYIPAVKLARLGVSLGAQKQGIGKILMVDAIIRTIKISQNAGGIGLFVDAKDMNAKDYYTGYGFIPLQDRQLELFLPLKTLLKLYSEIFEQH